VSSLALNRLPRKSLAEAAGFEILERIRSLQLRPGTKMPPERELVEELGIGRSTLREALNGLVMLGAVEIHHGRGAFVASRVQQIFASNAISHALGASEVEAIFEAREALECVAVRLAAERRTDADLEELEAVLSEHEKALAENCPILEPSANFHLRLADAAHNNVMSSYVALLVFELLYRTPQLEKVPGFIEWELEQHTGLYDAVQRRDGAQASERMRAHLSGSKDFHSRLDAGTTEDEPAAGDAAGQPGDSRLA
jgi:GntR family transcriptional repressor for pyruvate dehydrogenase complex